LVDALANIEQYAIDLAWDIIARFADFEIDGERLPVEYFLDWAKVAEDEAKHFTLLSKRLGVRHYRKILIGDTNTPGTRLTLWCS
jgi:uncharacterized ferritin-like protein (DUF455 family)